MAGIALESTGLLPQTVLDARWVGRRNNHHLPILCVRLDPHRPPGREHYHLIVLDGVFSTADGDVRFHPASQLTTAHWHNLQRVVQRRVLRYFRTKGLFDEADANGMRTWRGSGGFSVDASVRIEGHDRHGVERRVRYCARPPFALERLHAPAGIASLSSAQGRLAYRLPKPTPDGRTELRLTPLELLERLVQLIPPPRRHRPRYHGVLAP